jgi:hypothetical protein
MLVQGPQQRGRDGTNSCQSLLGPFFHRGSGKQGQLVQILPRLTSHQADSVTEHRGGIAHAPLQYIMSCHRHPVVPAPPPFCGWLF